MQKRELLIPILLIIVPMLLASFALAASCSDSDGGANYAVKGTVTAKIPSFIIFSKTVSYTDSCSWVRDKGTMLTEYSCKGDNVLRQTIACPNCKDGVCPTTAPTNVTCTDSDGGKNYYVKGKINLEELGGSGSGIDTCVTPIDNHTSMPGDTGTHLLESFCCGGICSSNEIYKCPNGCSNGACIIPPAPPVPSPINCVTKRMKETSFGWIFVGAKQYNITNLIVASDYVLFNINGEATDKLIKGAAKKLSDGSNVTIQDILYSSKETEASYVDLTICVPGAQFSCTDTDNGKNIFTKGITIGLADNGEVLKDSDYCVNSSVVREYYCSILDTQYYGTKYPNYQMNTDIKCPQGYSCTNGACLASNISCIPSVEVCDGKDNDCDGKIDEYGEGQGNLCLNYPIGYICRQGKCEAYPKEEWVCNDTDNGKDYFVFGGANVFYGNGNHGLVDVCENGILKEAYCDVNNWVQQTNFTCPNGCSNGACIIPPAPSPSNATCTDSDGGINYYVKGTCISPGEDAPDICLPDSQNPSVIRLNEKSCSADGKSCINNIYICPQGYSCNDGACVATPQNITATCQDTDNGKNYLVKGSTTVVKTDGTTEINTDFCNKDGTIKEWYCQGSVALGENVKCPSLYYCSNGLCRRLYIGGLAGRVIDGIKGLFINFGK
jgi:hypothetical protein